MDRVDCRSTYRWEGEVVAEPETVLFARTTDERYPDLRERVVDLYPHEVPCAERFDEADLHDPYAGWARDTVR